MILVFLHLPGIKHIQIDIRVRCVFPWFHFSLDSHSHSHVFFFWRGQNIVLWLSQHETITEAVFSSMLPICYRIDLFVNFSVRLVSVGLACWCRPTGIHDKMKMKLKWKQSGDGDCRWYVIRSITSLQFARDFL